MPILPAMMGCNLLCSHCVSLHRTSAIGTHRMARHPQGQRAKRRAIIVHEQELPTALAADLESHFERLVELYQHRLYAFALRLIGNPHDAEEIIVDAMVRAYQALGQYDPGRIAALELRPWLYQITLNVFRNRVRGRRLPVVSYDQPESPHLPEVPGDRSAQPEAALEQSELRDALATALATLPERERIAVTLRHIQGVAYADIAAILEQPVGTVKANVHRGVRRLRQVLSDDFAWRERR